jgi:hypothetical protein
VGAPPTRKESCLRGRDPESGSTVCPVDFEALKDIVDRLVEAITAAREDWDDERDSSRHNYRIARSYVIRRIPAVKVIARAVHDAPPPEDFEPLDAGWEFASTEDAALRLQGLLEVQTELTTALESTGPGLSAENLHPWVWEAASSL